MNKHLVIRIDKKLRSGALTGLAEVGEVYRVDKPSPNEIRFVRLMVAENRPRTPDFEKRGRFTVGVCPPVSPAALEEALAEFP